MKSTLLLAAASLACQLVFMGPAYAENQPQNKSKQAGAKNGADHTSEQVSHLSSQLLRQVDEGRRAIARKDRNAALQHVDAALKDAGQVDALLKAHNLPTLVPLYGELEQTSVLGPIEAAHKSGGSSSSGAQKNAKPTTPVVVQRATGVYTYVAIDLNKTKNRLQAAKTALSNNNLQAADDALSNVQSDVVLGAVESDLPLLSARENLGLAKQAAQKGRYSEAASALKEAATKLDTFAGANTSSTHANDARSLSQEIRSYASTIASNHSGAADKIDGWWHQVNAWFTAPPAS